MGLRVNHVTSHVMERPITSLNAHDLLKGKRNWLLQRTLISVSLLEQSTAWQYGGYSRGYRE